MQARMKHAAGVRGEEWRDLDSGLRRLDAPASLAALRAARANIPRLRQREVTVRVVDRSGQPLREAEVEIEQLRHEFPFGDMLWELDAMYRFGEHQTDTARYWQMRFTQVLNAATALCYWTEHPRNDAAKTEDVQGEPRLDGFAWCVDWAAAQGLTVKGHPLFWSIDKCVPAWLMRYDYATQMKFAEVRVRNLVARFRGKIRIWDVVNEPLWEPAFRNLAQRHWPHIEPTKAMVEYIVPVIRWARSEDPDATLVLNDYGLEADAPGRVPTTKDGRRVTARMQRRRMLALVRALAAAGASPSAIGLQSHTGGWIDPATQAELYDEMATSGLPIHITEFWAATDELERAEQLSASEIGQRQAEYIANYLTIAFGHPSVEAFFFWGFMGAAVSWRERSGHELTPVFHRVRALLHDEWHTRLHARTDRRGLLKFRGFYGEYALRCGGVGTRFAVNRQQGMPLTIVACAK